MSDSRGLRSGGAASSRGSHAVTMHALVTRPGVAGLDTRRGGSRRPGAAGRGADPRARGRRLRHRPRDRRGPLRHAARDGGPLVLGHEVLGVVDRDGEGFSAGDLVTATVRRSCRHCLACAEGSPDSCLTGDYFERGITRLDGFAREIVTEDATQVIAVPRPLGRFGVLAEPTSVCARAIRHAPHDRRRQPWEPPGRSCSAPVRSGCSRRSCCGSTASRCGPRRASGRRPARDARRCNRRTVRLDDRHDVRGASRRDGRLRPRRGGDGRRTGDGGQHRDAATQRRRVPARARRPCRHRAAARPRPRVRR